MSITYENIYQKFGELACMVGLHSMQTLRLLPVHEDDEKKPQYTLKWGFKACAYCGCASAQQDTYKLEMQGPKLVSRRRIKAADLSKIVASV